MTTKIKPPKPYYTGSQKCCDRCKHAEPNYCRLYSRTMKNMDCKTCRSWKEHPNVPDKRPVGSLHPAGSAALGWSYSFYRASLYLDGERFAIVTQDDGRDSLSKKDAALLLEALNRKPPNGSVAVDNCCVDWPVQIEKVKGPIVIQNIRARRDIYKETGGKPFRYCPWCGKVRPQSAEPTSLATGGVK